MHSKSLHSGWESLSQSILTASEDARSSRPQFVVLRDKKKLFFIVTARCGGRCWKGFPGIAFSALSREWTSRRSAFKIAVPGQFSIGSRTTGERVNFVLYPPHGLVCGATWGLLLLRLKPEMSIMKHAEKKIEKWQSGHITFRLLPPRRGLPCLFDDR